MSLRAAAWLSSLSRHLVFGGEAISFSTETFLKTGDCFVGKSKTPPRNDICTVENTTIDQCQTCILSHSPSFASISFCARSYSYFSKPDSSKICLDQIPDCSAILFLSEGLVQICSHRICHKASWICTSTISAAVLISACAAVHSMNIFDSSIRLATVSRLFSFAEKDFIRLRFAASPPKRTGKGSFIKRSLIAVQSFIICR